LCAALSPNARVVVGFGQLFGAAEPTWMDHGYREEEQEEPYYAETMSYRIYPEPPSSFTRYPEHPLQPLTFAHLFEPPPLPMFNNYPAALLPYGGHLFFEPPTKLVRFSDPGLEQQPARRPQVIRRSSQPKKVHPVSHFVSLSADCVGCVASLSFYRIILALREGFYICCSAGHGCAGDRA